MIHGERLDEHDDANSLATRFSPEEIMLYKARFQADPEARARVCRQIATGFAMHKLDNAQQPEGLGRLFQESDIAFAEEDPDVRRAWVDNIAAIWQTALEKRIALPGSEWPEGTTPLDDWVDVLVRLEEIDAADIARSDG